MEGFTSLAGGGRGRRRWRVERTLHVSCDTSGKDRNPSARAVEARRCELLFTCQLKLFFTPDICVGSPSCPQIESQILLFLFFSFFSSPSCAHWIRKQTRPGARSIQGRIPRCSKLYFSPQPLHAHPSSSSPSELGDVLLIINKHEAERSHSDIWRHFVNFVDLRCVPNRVLPLVRLGAVHSSAVRFLAPHLSREPTWDSRNVRIWPIPRCWWMWRPKTIVL